MTMKSLMRAAAMCGSLFLLFSASSYAQSPVPKDLEDWQAWVQDGREFQRCPFFANTDAASEGNRVCVWPARLNLDLNQGGGRFSQAWISYAAAWVPLPGSLEYWPSAVTTNGVVVAVVARDGIPQIRVAEGAVTVAGSFTWAKRPESLPIPRQTGLVALSLDGHAVDQVERPEGAVWLGKRREVEAARQLDVQVYRLLTDDIPVQLSTRLSLQVAGDAREEILSQVLPPEFQAMSLDSQLPARVDGDGRLRIQVRAGRWTVTINARALGGAGKIAIPAAQGVWPKQEIWSFAAEDRLRVAALEGAEGIDPAQANVPREWRSYPSYRVAPGGFVQIVERSRGQSQDANHLNLRRELYLDFGHQGYTVTDQIDGQMRSTWRLDMQAPYRLMSAASGAENLLVTEAEGATLTGVELRSPTVSLATVGRMATSGGAMAASGWTERFDHVAGVLNLPPGHRMIAALGADTAPGAWVERWGLLDLFLLLIAAVITLRLFGWLYACVTFATVALVHADNPGLVWLILLVLLTLVALRAVPLGRPRTLLMWARNLLLGYLLLVSVPFAVAQLRFAAYPQLADPERSDVGAMTVASMDQPPVEIAQIGEPAPKLEEMAPAAAGGANGPQPPNFVPNPRMGGIANVVVTAARKKSAAMDRLSVTNNTSSGTSTGLETQLRYAPGTVVQAGPGVPQWHYVTYPFGWSGPVESSQSVHFIILPPWLVALWRVLSIALLAALIARVMRGSVDLNAIWRRFLAGRAAAVPLILGALVGAVPFAHTHAASTPDRELLNELRARLARTPKCVPNCAEIMAARIVLAPMTLEMTLDIAALNSVAVAIPVAAQRFEPDAISIDGIAAPGVYRDGNQQSWIALKPGAHTVKVSGHLPPADSIQLLFPQVPRAITVSGADWDVSGVNAGRLLGNTIELLRHHAVGHGTDTLQGGVQFPPYVRVHRAFDLGLDWTVQTTVERLAPEKGGFTLEIPLLPGESVLTDGIETRDGNKVLAGFDSNASEFGWRSGVPPTDTLTLTAAKDKPWSEVWTFSVSPQLRAEFSGVPAVMPEDLEAGEWTYEYYPRAGEILNLKVSRPKSAQGGTLAVDNVRLEVNVGKRGTETALQLSYRSTQGGRHSLGLPAAARVTAVAVDGKTLPIRPEKDQLPLALLPGAHRVQVNWHSNDGAQMITHVPDIDLELPSSNVTSVLHLPSDRWVLYAGGRGVGPAILYWGELIVFIVLAVALGRSGRSPLRTYEWLLLGLGLSTFSWSVLLLFVVWMFAMRWRESFAVEPLGTREFNLLQAALIFLSVAAVVSLVAAIPFALLASPDMRIAGRGEFAGELSWFNDQAPGVLPAPWVLSLSLWWYKAAMLLWALWLAFALVRWLPLAWNSLSAGGFWRKAPRSPVVPASQ